MISNVKVENMAPPAPKKTKLLLKDVKVVILAEFSCRTSPKGSEGTIYLLEKHIVHTSRTLGTGKKTVLEASDVNCVVKLYTEFSAPPPNSMFGVQLQIKSSNLIPLVYEFFFEDILEAEKFSEMVLQYARLEESSDSLRLSSADLNSYFKRAVAVTPYLAKTKDELSLSLYDFLVITGGKQEEEKQYFYGRCKGKDGYFPEECVVMLPNNHKSKKVPSSFEWEQLISGAKEMTFEAGQVIVKKGDRQESKEKHIYIIMDGVCHLETDKLSFFISKGDIFGELTMLLDEPSISNVTVKAKCQVLLLNADKLNMMFLKRDPILGHKFYTFLSTSLNKRLRMMIRSEMATPESN